MLWQHRRARQNRWANRERHRGQFREWWKWWVVDYRFGRYDHDRWCDRDGGNEHGRYDWHGRKPR